jgi:hypothetical protein
MVQVQGLRGRFVWWVSAVPTRIARAVVLGFAALALALTTSASMALVGGAPDQDGRYTAVVSLLREGAAKQHCSATKIGERRFLTAAHCLVNIASGRVDAAYEPGGRLRISNAPAPQSPDDFTRVRTSATHIHPQFQVGLEEFLAFRAERVARYQQQCKDARRGRCRAALIRAKDLFTTRFPDVAVIEVDRPTPDIPTAELDLDAALDEATVTLVGYGCGSFETPQSAAPDAVYGERRWAESRIMKVDYINIHSYAQRTQADAPSLCSGDSGGPVLYQGRVVGVHGAVFGLETTGGGRTNMAVNLRELKRWQALTEPLSAGPQPEPAAALTAGDTGGGAARAPLGGPVAESAPALTPKPDSAR